MAIVIGTQLEIASFVQWIPMREEEAKLRFTSTTWSRPFGTFMGCSRRLNHRIAILPDSEPSSEPVWPVCQYAAFPAFRNVDEYRILVGGIITMRISHRSVGITFVFTLFYGGFVIACPEWTREMGMDVWNTTNTAETERNSKELAIISDRVKRRLEIKQILIIDLVEERTDLQTVAEQFHALNEIEPELTTYVRVHFSGSDDLERAAAQVISFTRTMLADEPSREEIVLQRLGLQLERMKTRPQTDVGQ